MFSAIKIFFVKLFEHVANVWYWVKSTIGGSKLDISQINEYVWCGGAITTDQDVAQLVALGVVADIDCREEFNDQSLIAGYNNLPPTPGSIVTHPQIAYCYDGVPDDGQPKPVSWFQTAYDFLKPIWPIAVVSHCAAGVNRGPSMAYFVLRAFDKMSGDDAYALLKQKRPVVNVAYRADADKAITALGLG